MIYDLLVRFLGEPINSFHGKKQYSFNCPNCANIYNNNSVDNKHNLEIKLNNTNKKFKSKYVCKCWKCQYSGTVDKLIREFAPKHIHESFSDYKDDYILLDNSNNIQSSKDISLPKEFIPFTKYNENDNNHRWVYNYITEERGISIEQITKYNIGFCLKGKYHHRIIIPSYDRNNRLNYFIARTFHKKEKIPYDNPTNEKTLIIINENNINWNSTIFLTEGIFDMLALPQNTIPLLGLVMYDLIFKKIIKYKPNVVICLDKEAIDNSKKIKKELERFDINVAILKFDKKDCGQYNEDKEINKLNELIINCNIWKTE